jgi:hypothetical protein
MLVNPGFFVADKTHCGGPWMMASGCTAYFFWQMYFKVRDRVLFWKYLPKMHNVQPKSFLNQLLEQATKTVTTT